MVIHICFNCKKKFNKKSHYVYHMENKKNSCIKIDLIVPQNPTFSTQNPTFSTQNPTFSTQNPTFSTQNPTTLIDILIKEPIINKNKCICMYCEKLFARIDSLHRHLKGYCKTKGNFDELEKLKEDMKLIIQNYQKIENENVILKKEIDEIKIIQIGENNKPCVINNTVNNNNNNNNKNNNNNNNINQINKGVIQNNTVNIQLAQFGNEDISKLNLRDAMKSYLKSTGGNIVSNMLKYINLNEQYPENNNICMTDLSREIVKIHNGKKFVYKKFKNVKDEILSKIVKNTRKIVNNYENDESLKKSVDTKIKIKINDVTLKIIDGISGDDIVRDEINEQEKLLIKNNNFNIINCEINVVNDNISLSEEKREFTFAERLRIEHLEKKEKECRKKHLKI